MREETRLAQALVFAEQLHGPTEAAYAAEQNLLAAAPPCAPDRNAESTPRSSGSSPRG